jgi:polar amino acid transport system substrate-binding protein
MKRILTLAALSIATVLTVSACANPTETGSSGSPAPSNVKALDYEADPAIVSMVPEDVKKRGVIVVGVNPDVPPVKFTDDNGDITGLAPQLVEAAGKIMGLKTEMQMTSFDALIPGLESNRIDMVASIGDFTERQATADFIDFLHASTGILASTSYKGDNVTLMDLCGDRIGYAKGTQQQGLLKSASDGCTAADKPAIDAAGYSSSAEAILAVKSGQADGTWLDSPTVLYNVNKQPADFKAIYTAPKPIVYGMAFKKDDKQFQEAFRAALVKIVEKGGYDSMLESYGLSDLAMPELPMNSGGPQDG